MDMETTYISIKWLLVRLYLLAGQIGNVDEGIVEAGIDVSHSEDILTLYGLRTKLDLFLLLGGLAFAWSHCALKQE